MKLGQLRRDAIAHRRCEDVTYFKCQSVWQHSFIFFCLFHSHKPYFHLNKAAWGLDKNTLLSDLFAVIIFFQERYEQHWSSPLTTRKIRPDSDCLNSAYIPICIQLVLFSREVTRLFDDMHPSIQSVLSRFCSELFFRPCQTFL